MRTPAPDADYFEGLFAQSDDPWRFKTRWYEERKRALTLACLPARRYGSIFEPGCANGELSAALAPRCDRLLVIDGSDKAVALARQRLADWPQAEARQGWMPDAWPDESFDLIVISELAYYLDANQLAALMLRTRAALKPGGTVVACHWRRLIEGCGFNGDEVHERLHAGLRLQRLCALIEPDFRLDVWCLDERSVAEREGLT
ncbi:SAM-dependent methyltransferase [Rhodoferax koreense]|uniref:SAM-dependent methyltransferase n=1 Tax=Rhodoferax koreensis TaxID=1842727 RepID=A0A1P8JRB3_9BURK|nr:SAM-dependent methyltransferase [Rhodoferax koreense]APW36307.1 SAM-dependent methyltransferase [Rhodoferax koreense]